MAELDSTYDHKKYELKWWNYWNDGGWFHAEVDPNRKPYTIVIPPPNVTDRLHMGHGLNNTIQDILIRWKRMKGFNCCWLPGTDHAGIATQMMVENSLVAKGTSRKELGREKFFAKCVEWKEQHGGVIIQQLKRIGASCDWQRQAYTMDEHLSKAVRKIFVDLFDAGLIYRGERLVNWCPALRTAVSDDEVESREVNGALWYFRYPIKGKADTFITIATTRPETMLGDTAVAVNPTDERFRDLIGETAVLPFVGREIPIIADDYVKGEFGSGAVKITPAHDPNDFEIGRRHKLPMITIMNDDGTIAANCPAPFAGMDRFEARKAIIKALKEQGLFEKEVSNRHAIPYSDRGKVPIEPMLSKQWFVDMRALSEPAIAAARSGQLNFHPDSWKKTYFHWLENIQDWCISRQLWWGHRIPIWHCSDCEKHSTGMTDPTKCQHCGSGKIFQDPDVLDTWFSSWLWPLSPFGWPENSADLNYFYPTDVLVTGPDIIFLWVARMVMVGHWTRGEIPFKDVYFNSIICDKQGRKFSKTLGNGIDPLVVIDQRGADAMRYTCVTLAPLGGRVKMSEEDFELGSRFVNKIWNAARFLYSKISAGDKLPKLDPATMSLPQKWLVHELAQTAAKVDTFLERFQINEAVEAIFHLTWRTFCDWGLEFSKEALDKESGHERAMTVSVLSYTFEGILRLLSPVMPFVTEELWQAMPAHHPQWDRPKSLVIANFPDQAAMPTFHVEAQEWERVMELISGIRSVRTQAGVPPKERIEAHVKCDPDVAALLDKTKLLICRLSGLEKLEWTDSNLAIAKSLVAVGRGFECYVPVGDYLDFDKEQKRLENEKQRIARIVTGLEAKLANPSFVERAPADVLAQTREQLSNMSGQLDGIARSLKAMGFTKG
jgi:valyl-tRNA synthetase